MTNRNDVYAAIDSERDYQEMRKQRDQGQQFHSVEEFILYMEYYLQETRKIASTVWGPEAKPATLEFLRKVVALGVACMEVHGAPQRKDFERTREQPEQHIVLNLDHAIRDLEENPQKGIRLLELVNPAFNRELEKEGRLLAFVQKLLVADISGMRLADFQEEARELLEELDEEDVEVVVPVPTPVEVLIPTVFCEDVSVEALPEAAPVVQPPRPSDWSERADSNLDSQPNYDHMKGGAHYVEPTNNEAADEDDDRIPF